MQNKQSHNHLIILFRGSIISFFGAGCLGILNYCVRRELALSLDIVDFGFMYSVFALSGIFIAYLDMGLGQSATILISKAFTNKLKNLGNRYYLQIMLIKLFFAVIVFIILALTYKFWMVYFFKYSNSTPFFILIFLIIIQAVSSAPGSVATALKRFGLLNTSQILVPVTILVIIYFFNPFHNINIYALAFLVGTFIMFAFLFIVMMIDGYLPKTKSVKELFEIGEIFHLSKWIALSTLGLTAMCYMDSLMITWLVGLKAVGLYNVALPIMQIAYSLMVIPTVFLPIVAGMWAEGKESDIALICGFTTEIAVYLFWPIAFTIILLAEIFIILLFSSKFTEAAPALIILFIGNTLFALSNFYMGTLNAGKNARLVAITIIIAAAVNITLNYVLIPYLSIAGAATATTISYLFITVCLYVILKRNLKEFTVNKNKICKFSILGVICILMAFAFSLKYNFNFLYILLFTIIINLMYFGITFKTAFYYYKTSVKFLKKQ